VHEEVDREGVEEEEASEYNEVAVLRLIRRKEIEEENRVVLSDEEELPNTEK
jgi:hypothetical protein